MIDPTAVGIRRSAYVATADLASLKFGFSETDECVDEPATSVRSQIDLEVGDGSGDFSNPKLTGIAYAQLVGGDYVMSKS